ncbi:glycoside hydrolase family 13 protein [Sphaerobolus stellatus SS14]|uniref:Glycoside hydrolase family 13 protein n=1 Tax=Sphaerobolus stellatus (strain SS14) TaxID=990650 RepID=A0A0C9VHQ2_SPHS4|nr:glycoside hydrolase family 13 protein [Sphaerobolus stellatus SS14]
MATSVQPSAYEQFTPFNQSKQYHSLCFVSDYNNQNNAETVVKTFYEWVNSTVKKYEIDGLRIDTVRHVRKDFWKGFAQSAGVWTVGEILNNNANYVSEYSITIKSDYIDSVLDYPSWFALIDAFSKPNANFSNVTHEIQFYKPLQSMPHTASLLENHDQPRFKYLTSDPSLLMNALAFTDLVGGEDPSSREGMWLSGFNANENDLPLIPFIKKLNAARKVAIKSSNRTFHKIPTSLANPNYIFQPSQNHRSSPSSPTQDPTQPHIQAPNILHPARLSLIAPKSLTQEGLPYPYPDNTAFVEIVGCVVMKVGS